ncbi:MAG: thioredoxin [Desulfobacteraceae bacterium]|nr:thioredoxin [Desulfobacteraceae bacterium]
MGFPTVYPTGTTIYDTSASWSGYTVFQAKDVGATIIDMNGNVVRQIRRLHGFPNRLLPDGSMIGSTGRRNNRYGYQDEKAVVQIDWSGKVNWRFDQYEYIEDPGEEPQWMARQHHDYQREGNPVGYYVPGMDPKVAGGNTLILCHKNLHNPKITDKRLLDDTIIEVDWEGNIIWEWVCSDHFTSLGFDETMKNTLYRNPNLHAEVGDGVADWIHLNSMSVLGPNNWFDEGDERFHPDNIIWSSRQTNIIAVVEKTSGNIVWQVGPDYHKSVAMRKMGWIIGPHHAHMIPRGLPGAGNILVFDNGGWAGYGTPNPGSINGFNNAQRDCSRVLEINPVTCEVVWKYTPVEAGFVNLADNYKFYSGYISSAQRLPNGNTLITEGADGRIFEITPAYELVWEYMSPFFALGANTNYLYRAYRYPYEWIPQLSKPMEQPVARIDPKSFRVPGGQEKEPENVMVFEAGDTFSSETQLCIVTDDEIE